MDEDEALDLATDLALLGCVTAYFAGLAIPQPEQHAQTLLTQLVQITDLADAEGECIGQIEDEDGEVIGHVTGMVRN